MAVSYKPLWKMLLDKDIKKLQFREEVGMSTNTLAKLGKNEYISMEIIDKICQTYHCGIADVVEIIHTQE